METRVGVEHKPVAFVACYVSKLIVSHPRGLGKNIAVHDAALQARCPDPLEPDLVAIAVGHHIRDVGVDELCDSVGREGDSCSRKARVAEQKAAEKQFQRLRPTRTDLVELRRSNNDGDEPCAIALQDVLAQLEEVEGQHHRLAEVLHFQLVPWYVFVIPDSDVPRLRMSLQGCSIDRRQPWTFVQHMLHKQRGVVELPLLIAIVPQQRFLDQQRLRFSGDGLVKSVSRHWLVLHAIEESL